MKKIVITVTIFVLALLTVKAQDAREIAIKSGNAINPESMEMSATLNIHDGRGNTRTRQIANATKRFGETVKTLIRFIAPPDVSGTTMLIHDYENRGDDMWIYLPAMRNTRRIVSSERGRSFMGTEFSNADMTKPNHDDFHYKLKGTDTMNGKECWKIEAVCKNTEIAQENGYSKRIAYIDTLNYLSYKVEYYNKNDKQFKVMTVSNYREISTGLFFAFYMEMKNVENGRHSEIIVEKFQLGSELSERNFSAASLGE